MATIRKLPSGRYQAIIRKKGLPFLSKTFSRKKDADEFVKHIEIDSELHVKLGKTSTLIPDFRSWVMDYIQRYSGRDHSTAGRLYWWCRELGEYPLTKIDAYMVDDALLKLLGEGKSGSTINRYKSTLSAVFIDFIQHPDFKRLGFTNPVRKEAVSRYKENPRKERFLDNDEQQRLLLSCRHSRWDRLYLLVLLALTTGARRGELLGLKWTDIDFVQRVASLDETKNGKPRLLPLTKPVIAEMMKFRESSQNLIFHGKDSLIKAMDIKSSWTYALKRAGISHCRFHDLRHTAASNLVSNGKTLFEVGTLLGHSSAEMTMRYSHLAITHTQNMVDEINGALS